MKTSDAILPVLCLFCCGASALIADDFPQNKPESSAVGEIFSELLETDRSVLHRNQAVARAHEIWKTKLDEAGEDYIRKLETFLEREQSKGDLDLIKGLKKALETAGEQHVKTPCLLVDRLPGRADKMLADLNRTKSRLNKTFLGILEKEISGAVKQKSLEEAKALERFLHDSFYPEIMKSLFPEITRVENKAYLFVDQKKSWSESYEWCRERYGDLVSINGMAAQILVLRIVQKQGPVKKMWVGGFLANGKWFWTDGTPFGFTYWAKGQPSGVHRKVLQDRISIGHNNQGEWDDVESTYPSYPFMIQWTLY